MDIKEKLTDVEKALNTLKEEIVKSDTGPIVGVQFILENVGRLSTKTLFFKGDFRLGDKVVIPDPCPFVVRNYGVAPVGIVVMNGNYAKLVAEAEGFKPTDEAALVNKILDIDVNPFSDEDEDEEED